MSFPDWVGQAQASLDATLASPMLLLGYVAAVAGGALVLVSAFVRTMLALRWLAVGSNIGFALYGALHPAPVTLGVASILVLVNVYRAVEMKRLTRKVKAAAAGGDFTGVWLRPYMRSQKVVAGSILFKQGDTAHHLFLLAEGQMELVEIGQPLTPGIIFGEIAFFAPDKRRTHTARCITDCVVLMIDEETVRQLYFQNPAFGFHLMGLVAGRLSADIARVRKLVQPAAMVRPD